MVTYEQAYKVVEKFNDEVKDFLDENDLVVLKTYKELQDKDVIGTVYRHDQWFFENISNFKAKYFGIKGFFLKLKDGAARDVLRKIDIMVDKVESQIKMLETMVFTARQRIRFYQDVIFIISNRSYGDY